MIRLLQAMGVVAALAGVGAVGLAFEDRTVRVGAPAPAGMPEHTPPETRPSPDSLFEIAVGRRVFAEPTVIVPAPATVTHQIPLDSYALMGVFAGSRPSALVAGDRGDPRLVSVGDSVGEAVVRAIQPRSVRLSVGDSTFTLTIDHGRQR